MRLATYAHAKTRHKLFSSAGKHAVLVLVSIVLGFPLLWIVLTSLKTNQQALANPPVWIPHPFVWSNYPNVISAVTFPVSC